MHKEFKSAYPKFNKLRGQLMNLAAEVGNWETNLDSQIAIQTDDPSADNWYAGIGNAKGKTKFWEHSFCHLQPSLKDTPVDEYLQWLDIPVYRARIMLTRGKSSYSVHRDFSPRLHLPLKTNTQCNFLITDPLTFFHLPADGTTTWVDTRNFHTFLNGSDEYRFHLVMIVKE